jgi:pimeloyl-ACP methyl ester carboxylesterase
MMTRSRQDRAMTSHTHLAVRSRSELVIALHCSGSSAAQWRPLEAQLGQDFELVAPEHYGSGNSPAWAGGARFTAADEAARTLALIDESDRKIHLIGHSYGGGIALHVALARPEHIASLTLYEPSAFYLLKQFGDGAVAFAEIRVVANRVAAGIKAGDSRNAAMGFVDYWSGAGTWDAIRPPLQDAVLRWLPKVSLEFDALFNEPTHRSAFMNFRAPVLIIRGEHAPAPTRLIADTLPSIFPDARQAVVAGAGHMGPITHANPVNALIVAHIKDTAARSDRHAA